MAGDYRELGLKELKARMKANYESPGLQGESTYDAAKAREIDCAVPRGNPDAGKAKGIK